MAQPLPIAKHGDLELYLLPALANRHGLITGAAGTGKTVSLQVLAERFSALGVPVLFLDEKGRPNVVERAYILPPASRIGPISAEERKAVIAASPVAGVYEKTVDRESAYEKLRSRIAASTPTINVPSDGGVVGTIKDSLGGLISGSGRQDSLVEAMAKRGAHRGLDDRPLDRARCPRVAAGRAALNPRG
jgi:hypothetical protein